MQKTTSIENIHWHTEHVSETLEFLGVIKDNGLSSEEIQDRRDTYGENVLEKKQGFGVFSSVAKQFKSPLVLILFAAGVATLLLREYLDMLVIFVALLINVLIGTIQEGRASQAFEKLNKSQEKFATVLRNGKREIIPVEELVVGDIVLLEGGEYVPADLRLISSKNLSINEAILTGEWLAVSKHADEEKGESTPLAERSNMAWMGTLVSTGYGSGVVVAVGERTQMGAIATELQFVDERATPLQKSVAQIARFLVYVILVAVVAIFILGLLNGESISEMLLVSIAVAVAAMPTGLPAAVTIVLAIGMESILKKGGLVRNLVAAETLGSATIILTDKTGTLTEANMQVAGLYSLQGIESRNTEAEGDNQELLSAAISTTEAFLEKKVTEDGEEQIVIQGRPMGKALVSLGIDTGVIQESLFHDEPRIDFLQFESDRRFGASLHSPQDSTKNMLYIGGVPEMLLEKAQYVLHNGRSVSFTEEMRKMFSRRQNDMSEKGFRVIAIASREVGFNTVPTDDTKELLEHITFLGLVVFADPVRENVAASITTAQDAGIRVVMVTGDNPKTAKHVAVETGIATEKDFVCVGSDIENLSDQELYKKLMTTPVFARVLPSQKLHLARVLKDNGEVVAMTGDGVNDAPALQSADIGVAVGSGTEVAKAASDIVLLNNSFSIITAAIREGRRIIDNLKKIASYLISTSFSEIILIGSALSVGAPLPLLPGQILWANIVEEGFMSFSFAFEGAEKGVMKRDPRDSLSKRILTTQIKKLIAIISIVTGVFLIALYFILLALDLPIEEIRTIMFVALSLDSIFFAFSFKSLHRPLWRIPVFDNRYLFGALFVSVVLLIGAVTLPPLRTLLSLTTLTPLEWIVLGGIGLFNLFVIEIVKYFIFERKSA